MKCESEEENGHARSRWSTTTTRRGNRSSEHQLTPTEPPTSSEWYSYVAVLTVHGDDGDGDGDDDDQPT